MTPNPPKNGPKFPRSEVQLVLGSWWDEKMDSPLLKRRKPDEIRKSGGTVFDIQPELASTQAVPVLLALSKVLSYEPDKKVIKRGGYRNKTEFVQDMCSNLEAEWNSRKKAPPQPATAKSDGVTQYAQQ